MSDVAKLSLSGDCGLRAIRSVHRDLIAALDATAILEIDCANAERIDLAFAQLISSAAKTAGRQAKQIRLVNLSDAGRDAFVRTGLCPNKLVPLAS